MLHRQGRMFNGTISETKVTEDYELKTDLANEENNSNTMLKYASPNTCLVNDRIHCGTPINIALRKIVNAATAP